MTHEDIYQNPQVTKSPSYLVSQPDPDTFSAFNTIDPRLHQARSKIVRHALGPQSISRFELGIAEQISVFVQKLSSSCRDHADGVPSPVNISSYCERLAFDVAGEIALGYSFDLQSRDSHLPVYQAIKAQSFLFNVCQQQPALKLQLITPLLTLATRLGYRDPFLETLKRVIEQQDYRTSDRNDSFYSLTHDKIEPIHMYSELGLLLLARTETVACGMASLFFYLSRDTRCYRRLAQEIRTSFRSEAEMTGQRTKLSGCEYLRACIDEALRMSPPILATLWRAQVPGDARPLVVDGHVIPEGVDVGVNTYAFHHNEALFPEPFRFRPERWLRQHAEEDCRASKESRFAIS
ncbi:cytochrome P450 [Xylariaceae sp. FL0594]|nr:cytochrome P450 [Xylariaceae sp. FL0594]